MVDVTRPAHELTIYALIAVPMPGWVCTPLFFASSVYHFSTDVGWLASVVLHILIGGLYLTDNTEIAIKMLLLYMAYVHVPFLIVNITKRRNIAQLITLIGCVMLSWISRVPLLSNDTFCLNHRVQTLISSHVIIDLCCPLA